MAILSLDKTVTTTNGLGIFGASKLENSLKFCYNILNVMKRRKIYD